MKDAIKKLFAVNTYFNAKAYRVLSAKSLADMQAISYEASQDDSIQDISWLKKYRQDVEDGKRRFYTTDCNWSNSHIYGIWDSLFGDMNINPIYTPAVEHGLILHDQIFNDIQDTARAACVTFGNFRKQIIKKYWNRPVFCVGPYVHYAKSFYSEDKIQKEKKKNGRTLLFFPMHSTNNSELKIKIENYKKYLRIKQNEFNTIMINTFWWNINDPLTDALKSEGYKIVSAGFRDDVMFMRRLKTLIQMSDLAAADSIGTHVGYCVDCGVPFSYEPLDSINLGKTEKENRDIDFCNMHTKRIAKTFYRSSAINEEQIKLCNYYWGNDQIKTKDDVINIVNFCTKTVKKYRGWCAKYYNTGYE